MKQSVVVGILIAFQIVWMQTTCLCISDVVKASTAKAKASTIKAKPRAKAWTSEAKAKATGPKAKAKAWTFEAKAKAVKIGLEAPRGQGLASRTTSLLCI